MPMGGAAYISALAAPRPCTRPQGSRYAGHHELYKNAGDTKRKNAALCEGDRCTEAKNTLVAFALPHENFLSAATAMRGPDSCY